MLNFNWSAVLDGCNTNLGVTRRNVLIWTIIFIIWMCAVCADDIDVSRNDKAEDLLSCPQRTRFENGWLWHFTIPGGQEHEKVHHFTLK